MAFVLVSNTGSNPISLPWPMRGTLAGGAEFQTASAAGMPVVVEAGAYLFAQAIAADVGYSGLTIDFHYTTPTVPV